MSTVLDDRLMDEILAVVSEIPAGRVATYGQIARLIGRERNARLVGRALRTAADAAAFPCHRVVDHTGRTAPGWSAQPALLRAEGVPMKDGTHVDLKRCRWVC